MSRELFLHIGTTKTGSTAIQNTLSLRRRELQQAGIYLQNRPAKASHSLLPASVLNSLASAPRRGHPMWGGVTPETRIERFRRDFRDEMNDLPNWASRCIISSEHLSNWLQQDNEVERLAELLRPFFARITVIVYLRRQDQHVSSGYNEILKSGIVPSPELAQSPENIRGLDYQNLLARYETAFGRARIVPRIFARESLLNNNVVDDFLQAIGIELSATEPLATNRSINLTGQHLLADAISRFGSQNPAGHLNTMPAWRLVTQVVESQCQGRGWKLAPDEARRLMSSFERSNEQVRSLYFPDRDELFSGTYDEPAADVPPTSDEKINASIDVVFRLAQLQCEREAQLAMAQYRLFCRLDDQAGMRDMLRQALRYAPLNLVARLRMAELMMADGRATESLDHLDAVLRLDPQNKEAKRKRVLWTKQLSEGVEPDLGRVERQETAVKTSLARRARTV